MAFWLASAELMLELAKHCSQGAISCCPGGFAQVVKVAGFGQAFNRVKRGGGTIRNHAVSADWGRRQMR